MEKDKKENSKTKFVVVMRGMKSKREVPLSMFEDENAAIAQARTIEALKDDGGFDLLIMELEPVKKD